MKNFIYYRYLLISVALGLVSPGVLADSEDLQVIRQQIEQMKQDYENRINTLEMRLKQAESRLQRDDVTATGTSATTPGETRDAVRATADVETQRTGTRVGISDPLDPTGVRPYRVRRISDSVGASAFNPAISVILDGGFFRDNQGGESFEIIEETSVFRLGGHDHGDDHGHGGLDQGFNLRHTEIALQASVDPYFDALAILAIESDGSVELEEAYVTTRSLPSGLQLKFGRFLSDVGYINRQHPHDYDFVDRPLVNEMLFGEHGLQELGAQISWVPESQIYTRFGLEVLQGETEGVANYMGEQTLVSNGDAEFTFDDKAGPRLFTGFAKLAPDLGHNHALQIGAFGGHGSRFHADEEHGSRVVAAEGSSWFIGTDWVYKYDVGGYMGHRTLKLQAEYMYRGLNFDLLITPNSGNAGAIATADALNSAYRIRQDGFYAQGVYGIAPRWQAGLRYDGIGFTNRGFVERNGADVSPQSLGASHRYTSMLTFFPTEFSRLRLQHSYGNILTVDTTNLIQVRDTEREKYHSVMLQFIMSLGAHGAHNF
jgi:hypothetical protein